jgi:hypothetical protein
LGFGFWDIKLYPPFFRKISTAWWDAHCDSSGNGGGLKTACGRNGKRPSTEYRKNNQRPTPTKTKTTNEAKIINRNKTLINSD